MRKITLAVLAAALMAPATASAGLVLGLGSGITKNGGDVLEGAAVSDYASWMVPVQLEAGWKFADRLTLTGFFTMNFGIVSGDFKTVCDAGSLDCLANQTRVGAQARWNFLPSRRLDPWVGVGVAWEVLGIESGTATSTVTTNYQGTGWDVQGGFDYWVSDRFSVSPYLGLSVGTYKEGKLVSDPLSEWEKIPETKTHTQVTAGLRIAFDFGGSPRSDGAQPAPAPTP